MINPCGLIFICEATYTSVNFIYDIVTIVIQRCTVMQSPSGMREMGNEMNNEQEMGNEQEFICKLVLVLLGAAGCQFRSESVRHWSRYIINYLLILVKQIVCLEQWLG